MITKMRKNGSIPYNWLQIIDWGVQNTRRILLVKVGFHASIYQLWRERNNRVHNLVSSTAKVSIAEVIISLILQEDVRNRISSLPKVREACLAAALLL